MNPNEHTEECGCEDCEQARKDFDAWCDDTDARWAKAEREGRVASLTAPSGLLVEVAS